MSPHDGFSPSSAGLVRWGGVALMLGGVTVAAFVLVLFPVGGFFWATRAHHPLWMPAHLLHLIAALLILFGLVGVLARYAGNAGPIGILALGLAFTGTALFVGTGVLTAFVWPVLADFAPTTIDPGGALFLAPAGFLFFLTALTLIPGYVLLAFTMARLGALSWITALLIAVGVVLAITPPEPVGPIPWLGLVLGGICFGVGAFVLGYRLWAIERASEALRPEADRQTAVESGKLH